MCGIMGYYCFGDNRPNINNLKTSLIELEERGDHGTGVAYKSTDGSKIIIFKTGLEAKEAFKNNDFNKRWEDFGNARPKTAIFHTRKASVRYATNKDDNDSHPFYNDKYVVIHNGQIFGISDMCKKYGIAEPRVDSSILPHILSEHSPETSITAFSTMLNSVWADFSIAFIIKNVDGLFLATNTKRPLELILDKTNNILYFASLSKYLDNIVLGIEKVEQAFGGVTFRRNMYTANVDYFIHTCNENSLFMCTAEGMTSSTFTGYEFKSSSSNNAGFSSRYASTNSNRSYTATNKESNDDMFFKNSDMGNRFAAFLEELDAA